MNAEKEKLRCQYCGTRFISVHRLDAHVKGLHFCPVHRCPSVLDPIREAPRFRKSSEKQPLQVVSEEVRENQ